jgi:hypothetical protein
MAKAIRWHLELGGEIVARIADTDEYDFPWTYGVLVESPGFERFRPYFTNPDDWPEDDPAIEALCGEVHARGGFALRDFQTGALHQGIRLNQRGESVWFRIG